MSQNAPDRDATQPVRSPGDQSPPNDTDETTFQTGEVVTVATGHLVHDGFSAFIPPLLPLLQERLGTSYSATGGLSVFIQIPSLLNPLIGYAADRVSLRYFIIGAPAMTATLCSALGLFDSYWLLALVLFTAGISVAAFHAPAPAMIGRIAGRNTGLGMSIFMASGELGRALGPILVASAIGWWGLEGIWRLAFIGWACSFFLFWRLRNISARPAARTVSFTQALPALRRVFPAVTWILLTKAFLAVVVTTYLPTFMSDVREANIFIAAAALSILEGAGVIGALASGTISDWVGRRRVLLVLFVLAPLFLFLFLNSSDAAQIPLLIALGLTAIPTTPVVLALVQDHFPDSRALANGILLAANFLTRASAVWIVGWMADTVGLETAYFWSGWIAFLAVPGLYFLPSSGVRGGLKG